MMPQASKSRFAAICGHLWPFAGTKGYKRVQILKLSGVLSVQDGIRCGDCFRTMERIYGHPRIDGVMILREILFAGGAAPKVSFAGGC
jgi:hypothetical protein